MFKLDKRIEQSSIFVLDLPLSQLRLQNDSRYPWLVLVPKIAEVTEVHHLTNEQQCTLIEESSIVAGALERITGCDKVNVANLGNVVSQLHWHVVARFIKDETWPDPIWGKGTAVVWEEQEQTKFIDLLMTELSVFV